MTMMGKSLVASSLRTLASASSPLMSGKFTSRIARSTGASGLASAESAWDAESAPSTRYPSPSRTSCSVRRMFFSSSTTSTVRGAGAPGGGEEGAGGEGSGMEVTRPRFLDSSLSEIFEIVAGLSDARTPWGAAYHGLECSPRFGPLMEPKVRLPEQEQSLRLQVRRLLAARSQPLEPRRVASQCVLDARHGCFVVVLAQVIAGYVKLMAHQPTQHLREELSG